MDSPQGVVLLDAYKSMGGDIPTRHNGPAVFMAGTWNIDGRPSARCQLQLAMHSGNDWQLFAWTSDHDIVNGTINSWDVILERFKELRNYQSTITIPLVRSGKFMVIWGTNSNLGEARTVRARMVYACGGSDRDPRIFDVSTS